MGYLDMGSKPDHFFTDLFLETGQDRNCNKHHGQPKPDAQDGNPDDGPGEVGLVLRQYLSGDKEFGVQQMRFGCKFTNIASRVAKNRIHNSGFIIHISFTFAPCDP
jgi:hypothetical protein